MENSLVGKCGLCLREEKLQDSHLIPAGFYRLLRSEGRKNPNPVHIGKGKANTTSEQISGHFLCTECEQRLNSYGEKYVLDHCRRSLDQFLLRELVQGMDEIFTHGESSIRVLDSGADEMAANCAFFAASVFWRASARTWRVSKRKLDTISLGPYEEDFRKFLVGETDFPKKSALLMQVSNDDNPDNVVMIPSTSRHEGFIRHKFYIPGLLFNLFVGRTLPENIESVELAPIKSAVFFGPNWKDMWFASNAIRAGKSKRVGKFSKP